MPDESITGGPFFCGDTSFFSLNRALQTIAKEKLTGWLRAFWPNGSVELLTGNGEIILATTRDPQLYCPDAPITLVNVDPERIEAARNQQGASGCPLFLTLAQEGLILRFLAGDVISICPPLIIAPDEIDELFARLVRALDRTLNWARAKRLK